MRKIYTHKDLINSIIYPRRDVIVDKSDLISRITIKKTDDLASKALDFMRFFKKYTDIRKSVSVRDGVDEKRRRGLNRERYDIQDVDEGDAEFRILPGETIEDAVDRILGRKRVRKSDADDSFKPLKPSLNLEEFKNHITKIYETIKPNLGSYDGFRSRRGLEKQEGDVNELKKLFRDITNFGNESFGKARKRGKTPVKPKRYRNVPDKYFFMTPKKGYDRWAYPVNTKARARAALRYGARFLSSSEYKKLRRFVHKFYPDLGGDED